MKQSKAIEWSVKILSFVFILLFTYASLNKLTNFNTFKSQLERSSFFSSHATQISYAIPGLELLIAGSLAFRGSRAAGFLFAYLLMFLFTDYVFAVLYYSQEIPCACGGIISQLSWKQHLLLNILLTTIAFCGIFLNSRYMKEVSK